MIKEYLEQLYPAADEETIDLYYRLVVNHETDKLPPTEVVAEYIKIKTQLKELEAKEAELRKLVIEQYDRLNHGFSGLNISRPSPKKYDLDKLYDWAITTYDPEFFEDCKSIDIDKTKLEQKIIKLLVEEKISVDDLPDSIYKESEQIRIEVSGSRKRK